MEETAELTIGGGSWSGICYAGNGYSAGIKKPEYATKEGVVNDPR